MNEITPGSGTQAATPEQNKLSAEVSVLPKGMPQHIANRYELKGVLARGGMGEVHKAWDSVLQRPVAVKLLLGKIASELIIKRFNYESHITGQLQHPSIPPVYDMGTLPDGKPFLVMKLIKGDTLDELIRTDRREINVLAVFEAISQAIGYAHSHAVIHRDLKPLNIMVGAFGEVQVMDWGLAKFRADSEATSPEASIASTFYDPKTDDDSKTSAGAILGTPAYMPPEQAIGAIDQVKERSDVFGLGGILCAMLTGKAVFVGDDAETTRQLAAKGKVGDAYSRLDASGAEPEVIALAKRCLSVEPNERPANGYAVAREVAKLRADADERAKQAEIGKARSEVRSEELRKRRRLQLALTLTVITIATAGLAFAWWQNVQANRRSRDELLLVQERAFKAEQTRQGVAANLSLASNLRRQYRYKDAETALAQAAELAKGAEELAPAVWQAQVELAFVVQLDDIRYRKWLWVMGGEGTPGTFNTAIAAPEYHRAFSTQNLDLKVLPPAMAAARIATSGVKAEVVAALDDWALNEPDTGLRDRLLDTARRADPGSWTDRLRDPAVRGNRAAIATLAADADVSRMPPAVIQVVAVLMTRQGLDPRPTLNAARMANPGEFELAFYLGQCQHGGPAIGPYEAARSLRPDNRSVLNNLGTELHAANQLAEAEAVLRRTVEVAPVDAAVQYNLANVFLDRQNLSAAVAGFRRAIDLDPKFAFAHLNLGITLMRQNDTAGAISSYRQAIACDPNFAAAHSSLGGALRESKDEDGALAAMRKAVTLNPKLSKVHNVLGNALRERKDYDGAVAAYRKAIEADPAYVKAHYNLGNVLRDLKRTDEGIAAYRRAIELDPKYQFAYHNLGNALRDKGDTYGAIAAYTRAVELDPTDASVHQNLGLIAAGRNDLKQAVEAFRTAIQLKPTSATAHNNLGKALFTQQDLPAATAAFRTAIDLDPAYALAYANLAIALRVQKKYPEAIATAREAIKLNPKIASAYNTLGVALRATGDAESAQEAFAEAARLDAKQYGKATTREAAPPPREAK